MNFDRADALRRLASEDFDVLVVGGGITGAGVALDAATRGLRVALVDKGDFASGTSSKSSKLVHGGIRYLQQKEVGLVYEALAERQILRKTAPHLVRVLPFLLPVFTRDGLLPGKLARILGATMWVYDLTGGLRIGKLHKRVSKEEALTYMPTLPVDRLAASYIYYDAQTDDARLTLAVAQTAADFGAAVANYAQLVGIEKDGAGHVQAARVRAGDEEFVVRARTIVNATGVWADDVRALDEGRHPDTIRPAKGIHITVPWSLVRNQIAAVVPVPKDRRSVFVVPWGDGATASSRSRTSAPPTPTTTARSTIRSARPTTSRTSCARSTRRSRPRSPKPTSSARGPACVRWCATRAANAPPTSAGGTRCCVAPSGVVTVTGGKLTTYRRMAADAVDEVMKVLERGGRSRTKKVKLHGATGWDAPDLPAPFDTRYGGDARSVLALARAEHELGEPIVPGLDYVRAEVVYAARDEMARTVDDVLSRRTRARLLARDASADAADDVAALMAGELGWDAGEQRRQVEHYRALVARGAAGRRVCPRPRSTRCSANRRSAEPDPGENRGMETNRGAPTPPIAFPNGAGRATARLTDGVVEVDDELEARLAATGADVTRAAEVVNEASRDWWPLAMIWALDDQVAGARQRRRAARHRRRRSPRSSGCATTRGCPSPPPPGAAASAARASRCSAACCSTSPRWRASSTSTTTSMLVDVLPGTFGDVFEDELRAEHGVTCGHWPQSMALSTVGGWLACRGAGQLSTRYGKIEDIVTGLDVVLADGTTVTTGGAPRAAVGPDLTQLFVGSEGTLGIIVGARLRVHPSPAAESARRVRVRVVRRRARRHAPHRAARRDAGRAPALRRDRSRPHLPDRRRERAARRSTKATPTSSKRPCASSTKSARPPTRSTSRSSSSGWNTATTCPRSKR